MSLLRGTSAAPTVASFGNYKKNGEVEEPSGGGQPGEITKEVKKKEN